ncbi:MAG: hypothetical protein KGL53_09100, partial [Elusimicrobia bacterium]|nr:hypothetical protein [Elusimicrobiota bacterium]
GAGGGGRAAASESERETNKMMAMYVGTVIYSVMAWLHAHIWYGQHISLSELLTKVEQSWKAPTKNGIRIGRTLSAIMRTKAFRAVSNSYLSYAKSYATNYYLRTFGGPDTYALAAKRIQENHVGLGTDGKSLITLQFRSPSTGRLYKIHTRIPRVETRYTAEGLALVAYAYRTGKETHTDGEEVYAKALALALLSGYGRKGPDGKWHHGSADGPVIGKLVVQLEYRSSHRTQTYSPQEFMGLEDGKETQGPIVQEITSTIERMKADADFQAMLDQQREEEKGGEAPAEAHGTAGKIKDGKPVRAAARTKKAPAAKTAKTRGSK